MKIVDLSLLIEVEGRYDERVTPPAAFYLKHDMPESAVSMASVFKGTSPEDFPVGWASESVRFNTHMGTHMSAPWHYSSRTSNGGVPKTIDQFPVEWAVQPAVKLDFTACPDGYALKVADVEAALAKIGAELKPLNVVLFAFGGDAVKPARVSVTAEVLEYLAAKGVHVIGVDAATIACDAEIGKAAMVCADKEFYSLECLVDLDKIPAKFNIVCFPIKVERGSAAWCVPLAKFE